MAILHVHHQIYLVILRLSRWLGDPALRRIDGDLDREYDRDRVLDRDRDWDE